MSQRLTFAAATAAVLFAFFAAACAPKVEVSTKDPIVINVNIKHEILIRVENDIENLFDDSSELFGDLEEDASDDGVSSEGEDQ